MSMVLASLASLLATRAVERAVFMAVLRRLTVAFNSAMVQALPAATLAAHLEASAMVFGVVFAIDDTSLAQLLRLYESGVLSGCGTGSVTMYTDSHITKFSNPSEEGVQTNEKVRGGDDV